MGQPRPLTHNCNKHCWLYKCVSQFVNYSRT